MLVASNHEHKLAQSQDESEKEKSRSNTYSIEEKSSENRENHVWKRVYGIKKTVSGRVHIKILLQLGLKRPWVVIAEAGTDHEAACHDQHKPSCISLSHVNDLIGFRRFGFYTKIKMKINLHGSFYFNKMRPSSLIVSASDPVLSPSDPLVPGPVST